MSKKRMSYNRRLAQATQAVLVEDGANFAEPDDIHKKLYGHKCPSQAVRKDITRRLKKIRTMLNREYGMSVFLITEPQELPKNMMEARQMVPGMGQGKRAGAIGRVNGAATQMIFLAEKELHLARGAGMVRLNTEDLIEARVNDRIPNSKLDTLIGRTQKNLTPRHLSGEGKLVAAEVKLLGDD